jgi:hypothetical protein
MGNVNLIDPTSKKLHYKRAKLNHLTGFALYTLNKISIS